MRWASSCRVGRWAAGTAKRASAPAGEREVILEARAERHGVRVVGGRPSAPVCTLPPGVGHAAFTPPLARPSLRYAFLPDPPKCCGSVVAHEAGRWGEGVHVRTPRIGSVRPSSRSRPQDRVAAARRPAPYTHRRRAEGIPPVGEPLPVRCFRPLFIPSSQHHGGCSEKGKSAYRRSATPAAMSARPTSSGPRWAESVHARPSACPLMTATSPRAIPRTAGGTRRRSGPGAGSPSGRRWR